MVGAKLGSTMTTASWPADSEPAHEDVLPPGSEVGPYDVERMLGRGGGGIVYAARHRTTAQRVAIKVMRAEMALHPSMVARFVREAEAVNRIGHPNIVSVYEFGELRPGRPYYVMELLEGMDLRSLLSRHGRFSPREVLDLVTPICAAVQAAHDAGIIHRDIKANNVVIVEAEDGTRVPKLLDFGIAKMLHGEPVGQGLTEPGAKLGTAQNMAPEQIRCERLDGRADIYALGVLSFQLLTGRYPFSAEDPREIALMHLQAPVPRPSEFVPLGPELDAVVLRCLEKNPERRFRSVSELVAALRSAVGESGVQTDAVTRRALAAYFEVQTDADEDIDEALFDDGCAVLDRIENELTRGEFTFPLRTATALLALRLLGEDDVLEDARSELSGNLRALLSSLASRPNRHPRLKLSVSLADGSVPCRPTLTGFEVLGGPLLDVAAWNDEHHFAVLA